MNHGSFAGRVGNDATLHTTPTGKTVLRFSVGVDTWGGPEGKKTLWVNCSMWGERGVKLAPILLKGTTLAVSGEVTLRSFMNHGIERAALELNASHLTLLSRPEPAPAAPTGPERAPAVQAADDIPF